MKVFEIAKTMNIPIEFVYQTAADIEKYPEFVPGILDAEILKMRDYKQQVKLLFHYAIFSAHIISDVILKKDHSVEIRQTDGPFAVMNLIWTFRPAPNNQTEIAFKMEYSSSGGYLGEIISNLLEKNTTKIMNAFVRRAEILFQDLAPT